MAVQSFAGQANVLLGDIFGHNSFFSTFITNNPVLSAVILVILLVFLIGAPLFFMDMIVDIWKVPFAVVIDLVVFFAYSNSSLVLPAIAASFLIFILLVAKKNKPLAWTLGLIISSSVARAMNRKEPSDIWSGSKR